MDRMISPDLFNSQKRRFNVFKEDYKLDMWMEIKRRWLIFGVLLSILLAVVSPRVGAPGGPLHSEYLWYAPLSYVYYSAGRRARPSLEPPHGLSPAGIVCACALTIAHAHVVAPALCALIATFADDAGLHRTLVKGALLSSVGGPCAWLALAVTSDTTAAVLLLAANYLTSLVAAPLALYVICGRAPIPALGSSIWSALCILPPFVVGLLYTHTQTQQKHVTPSDNCTHTKQPIPDCIRCVTECTQRVADCAQCVTECTQLVTDCTQCIRKHTKSMERCMLYSRMCALLLLYFDCCERLREAEGSLHLTDLLGTMVFALSYVSLSVLWSRVSVRLVPVPPGQRDHSGQLFRTLAACAVPKALHTGWQVSTSCAPAGLWRLPAVLAAPAQALLLAALAAGPRPQPLPR